VSRVLAGLVAVLAVIGAFFFGFFVLVLALGIGALLWVALALRMWWLRRQLAAAFPDRGPGSAGKPGNTAGRQRDVIDADYEVVSRREDV